MMEFRILRKTKEGCFFDKLQYREGETISDADNQNAYSYTEWNNWEDVPIVDEDGATCSK